MPHKSNSTEFKAALVLSAAEREIRARKRLIRKAAAREKAVQQRRIRQYKIHGIHGWLLSGNEGRGHLLAHWEAISVAASKEKLARLLRITNLARAHLTDDPGGTLLMNVEDFALIRGSWEADQPSAP